MDPIVTNFPLTSLALVEARYRDAAAGTGCDSPVQLWERGDEVPAPRYVQLWAKGEPRPGGGDSGGWPLDATAVLVDVDSEGRRRLCFSFE